jgi:hypothetical protein
MYITEYPAFWACLVKEYAMNDLPAPDSPANAVILLLATPPPNRRPDKAASKR